MKDESHNGFSNWHTWEAFNLLTNHSEEVLQCALGDMTHDNLEALIGEIFIEQQLDIEHLLFSRINYPELREALTLKQQAETQAAIEARKPKLRVITLRERGPSK